MATGGLYGQSGTGALIASPGSESTGLYGNTTNFGGTYFEWFIFQESVSQPATPTGGSWSFSTNTGTPPSGWTLQPPSAPVNQVWVSIALVNSRSTSTLVWSVPGLFGVVPNFTFPTPITGAAGSNAAVVNTGTATNPILTFTIPRGDTGATGAAATIAAGTTTTTNPGTNASVTNVGTSGAAVFNFSIPRGAGVNSGGTAGQFLTKASGTDYDTTWTTITGTLSYQGSWNASTNTPTLTSSVGTNGYYYVVSVAGSTNLNGITDWVNGDWAIFNGSAWQKIDNTDLVTSVAGRTGAVVLSNTDISGLGTMSTQNANSVAIIGGAVDGTTVGSTTRSSIAGTTELIGPSASANFTRFPNALSVVSNTSSGIQQNESAYIGQMAEGVSVGDTWGVGLYGAGYTNSTGTGRGTGVTGEGHVSASADTGVAVGVRGYANDVHSGNYNIGLYGDATNSTNTTYGGNIALFLANGNIVTSAAAAKTWYLGGNITYDGQGTTKTIGVTNGATFALGTPSSVVLTNATGLPNAGLVNSSVTLGSTSVALGATAGSLAGLSSVTVTGDPTTALQLATKQYVDAYVQGINAKGACRVASTGNVVAITGLLTIDGQTLVAGDRVLLKDQATASQNGIYVVSALAWSRAADLDTWPEAPGAFTFIEQGTVNAGSGWVTTVTPGGTIGVTSMPWTQFSGVGTYTAGTGLSLTGSQFAIDSTVTTLTGSQTLTNKTLTSPTLTTPALGTPASGNLANCTFPALNQNTTGSAGSLASTNFSIVESGGKLLFKYGATTIASMSSTGVITSAVNIVSNGTP